MDIPTAFEIPLIELILRAEYLTKRACTHFDSINSMIRLWVTGRLATELPEAFQIFNRDVITKQVKQAVLQHTAVAV